VEAVLNPLKVSEAKDTQEVLNQPPPLTNYNLYLTDITLAEAIQREGAGWAEPRLRELGRLLGTEEV
jgi:putative acyl-CoA dehydrogenase